MAKPFDAIEISIQLQKALYDDVGETAFAILRNLITRSPVGEPENWMNPDAAPEGYVGGHFRRNWLVSIGGFNTTELAGTEEPIGFTLGRGKGQINAFKAARAARLIIQNNVPYAHPLAQGHSLQADFPWVDEEIEFALRTPGGTRVLA